MFGFPVKPKELDVQAFWRGRWQPVPGVAWEADVQAALALKADAAVTPPIASTDPGVAGQWAYDATYLYICIATDTWRRIPHATW